MALKSPYNPTFSDSRPASSDRLPAQLTSFTISVVAPVYNSEGAMTELVHRLQAVLSSLAGAFEIILVNDGSRDRSWQTIGDLAAQFPFVHGLDLMRNYEQHNALLAGIRAAKYDLVVTLDDTYLCTCRP